MLDLVSLAQALGAHACRFDADLLPVCDSTNAVLLGRAEAGAPSGAVVIAAAQTAGRGRRGRAWVSAPGDSLTFSLLWRFAPGAVPLGLSLAAGVAVTNALAKVGAGGTALKWPNDVLKDGRKLSGILVELVPGQTHAAVIGIGLNLRLPESLPSGLRETAAALDVPIATNVLLATLLIELRAVLERFAVTGFVGLRADWLERHVFQERPVLVAGDFAPPRAGLCRGVDDDGALLLEAEGRIERILTGDVSLRGAA
ncbi:MAG: biotin--[acetyl-CoA-carboxylase] ligase [Sulfuritalea sp.]|nr:biotin--[acetyl-CoA-carboxylase] ligase [Sulfuritalea sp.]